MKKLAFAVVGTNFISSYFLEAIAESELAYAAAIYSRTEEKGQALAEKHGIKKVYTDYGKMLSDTEIDAVYVASPTMLHCEHSVAALRAGKHVLSEKMIAVDFGEFSEMERTAEECGLVLLEAMRPDFDPIFNELEKKLSELGKIKEARLEFCQYSSRYDKFKLGIVENAFKPEMKNSALSDIGIYPLHLAVRLFGKPKSLHSKSRFLENSFEGAGEIRLEYEGFDAVISYSKIYEGENISRIVGEGGTLLVDKMNAPKYLRHYGKDGELISEFHSEENNILAEINAFCGMIMEKSDFRKYLNISRDTMALIDMIYEKSEIHFPNY